MSGDAFFTLSLLSDTVCSLSYRTENADMDDMKPSFSRGQLSDPDLVISSFVRLDLTTPEIQSHGSFKKVEITK